MLQASNFADVADNWGISFTVWGGNSNINPTSVDVLDLGSDGVGIIESNKIIKMLDESEKGLYWIKGNKQNKKETIPRFTSAINYDVNKSYTRNVGTLATLIMDMGIVESNLQRVALMPSRSNANWTILDIMPDNFDRCISYFTARKLIAPTWINSKDEYMIPNTEHPLYKQWQADCIVYSLFNVSSNQSSLRNIEYNGKIWNIYNEFFWLSREQIIKLASGEQNQIYYNPYIYDDCINHAKSERFVYQKLQTVELSEDAKFILDFATALLKDTFQYRQAFDTIHPEYHINTWDAGWYQIKALVKEYKPNELKVFNERYKAFEDRMRPLVYELGFLYK
jgi:hypothetical protein